MEKVNTALLVQLIRKIAHQDTIVIRLVLIRLQENVLLDTTVSVRQ